MAVTDASTSGSLSKQDEVRLIRRAVQGDRAAGARLVDYHKQRLYAFIWRMVRDPELADDVCQETFLRAFGALGTFNETFRFSTWLFTIGYRLALNEIRSRSHRRHSDADVANLPERSSTTALDRLAQSEQALRLRAMIWDEVDRLRDIQKAVVTLFYREGLACRDISEALDIPVATVKSHLHRARRKLRERLRRHGVDNRDLAYLGA